MRLEVTILAGSLEDPVIGFQKVTYVQHAEPGGADHWVESSTKLVKMAEEGLKEVREQVDGFTGAIQGDGGNGRD